MADFKKVDFAFTSKNNAIVFIRGLFAVDQKAVKLNKTQYASNITGHRVSEDGLTVRVLMTGTTAFPTREAMALMLAGTHNGIEDALSGVDYRMTIELTPPDDRPSKNTGDDDDSNKDGDPGKNTGDDDDSNKDGDES